MKEKLILFIHGFLGDENTWGNFKDLLDNDTNINTSYDVEFFEYPTFYGPISIDKALSIDILAQGLRSEIEETYLAYNEIILVCHSMGGLVAKQYLINEILEHKQKLLKVKKIIYYATPHLGTQLANYAKLVNHKQIKEMATNSNFIENINKYSIVAKLEKYIDSKYIIAGQDNVVNYYSAQEYYANSNSRVLLEYDHRSCCKPSKDTKDLRYLTLKNFILSQRNSNLNFSTENIKFTSLNENNTYTNFIDVKKILKIDSLKKYDTFIKKIEENYGNKKGLYFGLSIYQKNNDAYNVLYSLSSYTNKTINTQNIISENDFSGLIFDKISDDTKVTSSKKNHAYLKEFFNDIDMTDEDIGNELLYYTKVHNIDNSFYIQFYLVFSEATHAKNIESSIKEFIKDELIGKQQNTIKIIPHSDIKLMLKKGINELENEIILLVDLIRSENRMKSEYRYMDTVLTSKLIYKLKKIAGEFNFKSINHTGDGFIFVYRSEHDNVNYDIRFLISKIEKVMNRFYQYFTDLNEIAQDYKVRGIIGRCKTLFEIDYINSIDRKLYFSSDLDQFFKNLSEIEKCEEICLQLDSKQEKNLLFCILNYEEIGLTVNNKENFSICSQCELNVNDSILDLNNSIIVTGVKQ